MKKSGGTEQPNDGKQYTCYERDTETGLDFAQARYYNSRHGRFTSPDPLTASATIRDPQSFNRYTYALNSPYKFTDPLGLLSQYTTGANGRNWDSYGLGGGGALSGALSGNHQNNVPYEGDPVVDSYVFFGGYVDQDSPDSQQSVIASNTKEGVCSIELVIFGPKSPDNNLVFPTGNQNLGPVTGSVLGREGWYWQVEVRGTVAGDASKWFLGQRVSETQSGEYRGRRVQFLL